jgi:hypothetical protein
VEVEAPGPYACEKVLVVSLKVAVWYRAASRTEDDNESDAVWQW